MGGCAYSQLRKLDVRHHNALPLHCNTLCQFFHNFVVNVMEWQNRTKTHVSGWWLLCYFCYNFVTKIGDFTTTTGVPVTTNLSSFLSISQNWSHQILASGVQNGCQTGQKGLKWCISVTMMLNSFLKFLSKFKNMSY